MAVNPYQSPRSDHGKSANRISLKRILLYSASALGAAVFASLVWRSVLGIPEVIPTAVFCGVALILSGACGALATNIALTSRD